MSARGATIFLTWLFERLTMSDGLRVARISMEMSASQIYWQTIDQLADAAGDDSPIDDLFEHARNAVKRPSTSSLRPRPHAHWLAARKTLASSRHSPVAVEAPPFF